MMAPINGAVLGLGAALSLCICTAVGASSVWNLWPHQDSDIVLAAVGLPVLMGAAVLSNLLALPESMGAWGRIALRFGFGGVGAALIMGLAATIVWLWGPRHCLESFLFLLPWLIGLVSLPTVLTGAILVPAKESSWGGGASLVFAGVVALWALCVLTPNFNVAVVPIWDRIMETVNPKCPGPVGRTGGQLSSLHRWRSGSVQPDGMSTWRCGLPGHSCSARWCSFHSLLPRYAVADSRPSCCCSQRWAA
jgi:hypothetical protein